MNKEYRSLSQDFTLQEVIISINWHCLYFKYKKSHNICNKLIKLEYSGLGANYLTFEGEPMDVVVSVRQILFYS